MSLGDDNIIYIEKEITYEKIDSPYKTYKIYKTKEDILPNNSKYKPNQKIYIKLDPEYLENNYKQSEKKFTKYNNRKNITFTNNPININNTYYNNKLNKNTVYLRNQKEMNSPLQNIDNFLYYGSNTLDNSNRKKDVFVLNTNCKTLSPIKKNSERKSYNFYINNNNKYIRNYNNNFDEKRYKNKSIEYNILNSNILNTKVNTNTKINTNKKINTNTNKNINTNNINNKLSQTQTKNDIYYINKYQKKMTTIFIQILNRFIEKYKRRKILTIFFNQLKNNKNNNSNNLFTKKVSKYNEYKDINNFIRSNNNAYKKEIYIITKNENENALINNIKKEKKVEVNQRNNNKLNYKSKTKVKINNDIKRLIQLQKKYDNIYEKKRIINNNRVDDNFQKYIMRKNKTQNTFITNRNTINNINNDHPYVAYDPVNEQKKLRNKLLKNRIIQKRRELSAEDLDNDYIPPMNYRNEVKYTLNEGEKFNTPKFKTPRNTSNKKVLKNIKSSPNSFKNVKNKNKIITKEETYEVYNIKDIVTPDKRLYVYINYINLYNKKADKRNRFNYYDNRLLKISNRIIIKYINKRMKYKPQKKYYINYPKGLTKIEEESMDSNIEKEKRYKKYKNLRNFEQAISILERYKNNLKKSLI